MWLETLRKRWFGYVRCSKSAPARARSSRQRPRSRPHLEALEDRTLPSTLTVTTLTDSANFTAGDGSLRGEIAAAQSGDTIQFNSSLANGTL